MIPTRNTGSVGGSDSEQRPRKICLFGTSANPPTGKGGHVGLVESIVKLQKYDEVRVLPVYQHTFSSKRNQLIDYSHRVAMCELAFLGTEAETQQQRQQQQDGKKVTEGKHNPRRTNVIVSRAEEDSFRRMCLDTMTDEEKASLRVGTADLLEMLIKQEKEKNDHNTTEFSFCLGADTFMDLTDWKWKRSKDVLKLLGGRLVVVNRKQQRKAAPIIDGNRRQLQKPEEKTTEESLKERVNRLNSTQLANGEILVLDLPNLDDVSSSKVRNCRDKDVAKKLIPNKVLDYIVSHNLYGFGDEDDGEKKDDAMKG